MARCVQHTWVGHPPRRDTCPARRPAHPSPILYVRKTREALCFLPISIGFQGLFLPCSFEHGVQKCPWPCRAFTRGCHSISLRVQEAAETRGCGHTRYKLTLLRDALWADGRGPHPGPPLSQLPAHLPRWPQSQLGRPSSRRILCPQASPASALFPAPRGVRPGSAPRAGPGFTDIKAVGRHGNKKLLFPMWTLQCFHEKRCVFGASGPLESWLLRELFSKALRIPQRGPVLCARPSV